MLDGRKTDLAESCSISGKAFALVSGGHPVSSQPRWNVLKLHYDGSQSPHKNRRLYVRNPSVALGLKGAWALKADFGLRDRLKALRNWPGFVCVEGFDARGPLGDRITDRTS